MATFLERIVDATLEVLAAREAQIPLKLLSEVIGRQRPARGFVAGVNGPPIRLIAEIKRASPSKGDLNTSLDPVSLALQYERAGAAAVSVLTEPRFFKGRLGDLSAVSSAVGIPVLRKDFILNTYQVYEARAFGADAVLLIAAILSDEQLGSLLDASRGLGMGALVEVHDEVELDRVLELSREVETGMCLEGRPCPFALGINNRDLKDFTVDLERTLTLRARVPANVALVSESGIHTRDDVLRLDAAGVGAILVGETLVTCTDPGEGIRNLLGW